MCLTKNKAPLAKSINPYFKPYIGPKNSPKAGSAQVGQGMTPFGKPIPYPVYLFGTMRQNKLNIQENKAPRVTPKSLICNTSYAHMVRQNSSNALISFGRPSSLIFGSWTPSFFNVLTNGTVTTWQWAVCAPPRRPGLLNIACSPIPPQESLTQPDGMILSNSPATSAARTAGILKSNLSNSSCMVTLLKTSGADPTITDRAKRQNTQNTVV